ncbi:MAG: hypothetical protein RL060_2161 [Bacteroidota bacterium]|jgi:uncharacterized protein (DUF1697 family)
MPTYIALLRGINVSGQKLIKMADLKDLLASLPLSDIRTYIQSGNVVFEAEKADEILLAKSIETKIKEKYAFEVPTIVRTREELLTIIQMNPFEIKEEDDFTKPYVIFLETKPDPEQVKEVMAYNSENEIFEIIEKVVYIVYKSGAGKSKLTNTFFETKLKTKATSRNWNTVNKLCVF